MRLFGGVRRRTSSSPTRPVTPEVAGSSPVAPVSLKCLQIGRLYCLLRRSSGCSWPNHGPRPGKKRPANRRLAGELVAGRTNKNESYHRATCAAPATGSDGPRSLLWAGRDPSPKSPRPANRTSAGLDEATLSTRRRRRSPPLRWPRLLSPPRGGTANGQRTSARRRRAARLRRGSARFRPRAAPGP
jgi:hypothetical protein